MGDVSGRFLKYGANALAIPITQICNLSHSPQDCKVAKLKPLYKKGAKTDPKILDSSRFYQLPLKFLRK